MRMRLSKFSYYALRVLLYLQSQPSRFATISEIAAFHGISESHLMKVVHKLGSDGLIETVRGKGGGLRIARGAEKMAIGEVLRQTETALACVDSETRGKALGSVMPSLRLHDILDESRGALFEVLDRYTVADLVAGKASIPQARTRQGGIALVARARRRRSPTEERAEAIATQ
jgi:Rrf2 family nitric oxide-sensitive transcriptional repressor